MKKLILSLHLLLLLYCQKVKAQIEQVIVETYYVSDANDLSNAIGGTLDPGSITYRIYIDLKEGSILKKVYGDAYHPLSFKTTTKFYNHKTEGKSFAKEFNKNRFGENTVALDTWLTLGQISSSSLNLQGILKIEDTNGSFIGGVNNDSALLANNNAVVGIPLTTADGIIPGDAILTNWGSYGIVDLIQNTDSTIFGSLVDTNEFTSYNAGIQNSGTKGPAGSSNKVLIAQLTTNGSISFKLNAVVEFPNPDGGTYTVKYVANDDTLMSDEQLNPYLSFPFLCGCRDANYLEYSNRYACDYADSCVTKIVIGCLDTVACNYSASANFHVQSLCCYPGYCNDRNLALLCPEFAPEYIRFYLYPNPADQNIFLKIWINKPTPVSFTIQDVFGLQLGNEVTLGTLNNEYVYPIDISALQSGIYYLNLTVGSNTQRKIFIKNR